MSLQISEKDKKLLLVLAVIAVICIPYLLLIQPMLEKLEAMQMEVAELESRKMTLEQMKNSESVYQEETEWYAVEKEELLGKFPSQLLQEAEILFIDNVEKEIPISLYQVNFGEDVAAQIVSESEEEAIDAVEKETGDVTQDEVIADTTKTENIGQGLTAISSKTQFTYDAGYEELKDFLAYILNHKERMVITDLTASFTSELNVVNGNFSLVRYALQGEDRPPVNYLAPARMQGTTNIFMQATGNVGESEAVRESDFFLMLNQPDADLETVIFGQTSDTAGDTYLTSDENKKQEATITFSGEDGSYTVSYGIGKKSLDEEIAFEKEGKISFEILSSIRANEDKTEVVLNIVNETDTVVNVDIKNDDPDLPRVQLKGKTGDIFVQ